MGNSKFLNGVVRLETQEDQEFYAMAAFISMDDVHNHHCNVDNLRRICLGDLRSNDAPAYAERSQKQNGENRESIH